MRKYKYITVLIVLSLAVSFSACKKFLDEELKGQRADVQFFETAEDAELYLTGIYNVLSFADADNRFGISFEGINKPGLPFIRHGSI